MTSGRCLPIKKCCSSSRDSQQSFDTRRVHGLGCPISRCIEAASCEGFTRSGFFCAEREKNRCGNRTIRGTALVWFENYPVVTREATPRVEPKPSFESTCSAANFFARFSELGIRKNSPNQRAANRNIMFRVSTLFIVNTRPWF